MTGFLELEGLKKYYPVRSQPFGGGRQLKAVDGVSLGVDRGECMGLVGESGCGKTTLGRLILRLEEPTDGRVVFDGRNILEYGRREMRVLRRRIQIIFQDPYSSLNPRKSIGAIIGESLAIHRLGDRRERRDKVLSLMADVGLRPEQYNRYPHEFSGGQRQRVGIARALALNPDLIVADEPVSALDVSIQAQVVNLLKELQDKFNLTYLFIAHDLSLVRHVSDRLAVMYLGRLAEIVPRALFGQAGHHPYTLALLESIPLPRPGVRKGFRPLTGDVPSPVDPPSGCRFHPRCPERIDRCSAETPELREIEPGHRVACHRR
ncbi:MAG: ATP-binding cassette domain-containing protein [Proteobacteria bacterium]|nr:ATP-binding cassette domain-containing protein [Pseudomonadota bacterium]